MGSQLRRRAPPQLAMKSFIMRIQVGHQTLGQRGPGQALGNDERIVIERGEEFAQHFGLFGVTGHALHLGSQLFTGEWLSPVILERLRIEEIVFDLLLYLCCWHDRVERRFGIGWFSWPDAMTPINFFDGPLIRNAIGEGKLAWRGRISPTCEGFGEEASGVSPGTREVNSERRTN